jgi:hypothetical protein
MAVFTVHTLLYHTLYLYSFDFGEGLLFLGCFQKKLDLFSCSLKLVSGLILQGITHAGTSCCIFKDLIVFFHSRIYRSSFMFNHTKINGWKIVGSFLLYVISK